MEDNKKEKFPNAESENVVENNLGNQSENQTENPENTTEENKENISENISNIEEKIGKMEKNIEEIKENTKKQPKTGKKKRKVVSRILGTIWRIFLIAVVTLTLIILVRALVYKKYDVFGYRFYLIMSGSMEPTIHVSDAVITKEQDTYVEGDIISFNYGGAPTVHRIVKVYTENDSKMYQTKGDNNNTEDKGLQKHENVYGKVMYRIPKVGDAIIFIQRNIVIILILMLGVFIIISLVRRLI